jgi:hypothetical protein
MNDLDGTHNKPFQPTTDNHGLVFILGVIDLAAESHR